MFSSILFFFTCVSLREKCPNTELFLVRIFPHSDWIRREYLNTQCIGFSSFPINCSCFSLVLIVFMSLFPFLFVYQSFLLVLQPFLLISFLLPVIQKQPRELLCKKGVLKNFWSFLLVSIGFMFSTFESEGHVGKEITVVFNIRTIKQMKKFL